MALEKMTEKELINVKETNKKHIKKWENMLEMLTTSEHFSGIYYVHVKRAIKKAKVQNHRIKAELNYRKTKREQCRV